MWSIWNEPNQPQFLMPQYSNRRPASPKVYRRLYQVGVKALRATPANADDTYLLAETSPRGNSRVVFPLAFFRGMLCLDVRLQARASAAAGSTPTATPTTPTPPAAAHASGRTIPTT